jgi:transcriptional regulator with XRE-family HTH domain
MRHPIFDLLEQEGKGATWLGEATMYSPMYIRRVRRNEHRPGPRFRRACAQALGKREEELFSFPLVIEAKQKKTIGG